jgi:hypothetical protein
MKNPGIPGFFSYRVAHYKQRVLGSLEPCSILLSEMFICLQPYNKAVPSRKISLW